MWIACIATNPLDGLLQFRMAKNRLSCWKNKFSPSTIATIRPKINPEAQKQDSRVTINNGNPAIY